MGLGFDKETDKSSSKFAGLVQLVNLKITWLPGGLFYYYYLSVVEIYVPPNYPLRRKWRFTAPTWSTVGMKSSTRFIVPI